MGFEALDMFRKKSALCVHANNSIWPMQGGILPLMDHIRPSHIEWYHCIFRLNQSSPVVSKYGGNVDVIA